MQVEDLVPADLVFQGPVIIATSIRACRALLGYKRTLRSNDISVQLINGIIDVDLDISFTLQYPHFIKRRNNCLFVMLQRRKKYKGRPIPASFKTLALGVVNLTEVLQSASETKDIHLYSEMIDNESDTPTSSSRMYPRHKTPAAAKLFVQMLNSQPLEQDDYKGKEHQGEVTEEEDDDSTANEDAGGGSDSENFPGLVGSDWAGRIIKGEQPRTSLSSVAAPMEQSINRQKNLKQKFVAMLKKLKIPEEQAFKETDTNLQQHAEKEMIRDLLYDLEDYWNSDQEMDADTVSVKSTPKPRLRPYFSTMSLSKDAIPAEEERQKESEASNESGGDSASEMNTTDPEALDTVATAVSHTNRVPVTKTVLAASAASKAVVTTNRCEEPKTDPTAPQMAPIQKKKKASFPKIRQISADVPASARSWRDAKSVSIRGPRHHSVTEGSRNRSIGRLRGTGKSAQSPTSANASPVPSLTHQPIAEQIGQILPMESNVSVPDMVVFLSAFDIGCQILVDKLREKITSKLVIASSQADVKTVFNTLVNRIQKYCNTNAFKTQNAVKLVFIGGDQFFAYCLKSYTEAFAQKSNEWLNYARVFAIGWPRSVIGRFLAGLDQSYAALFNDGFWRDSLDKQDLSAQEITDVTTRILRYVQNAKMTVPISIAEVMLQLKDTGTVDETSHVFVPFVVEVRKATSESTDASTSESLPPSPLSSVQLASAVVHSFPNNSPPATAAGACSSSPRSMTPMAHDLYPAGSYHSPPGSPHFLERSNVSASGGEAQDLQIEYWLPAGVSVSQSTGAGGAQRKDTINAFPFTPTVGGSNLVTAALSTGQQAPTKYSLKTSFKSLIISRFPSGPSYALGEAPASPSSMMVQFVKEKKKDKVLQKLGMKNREKIESEQKCQSIEGISRLICSAKHNATMKVHIDGVEWTNVKFFQVSSQWQTHVKVVPIALFHTES